MACVLLVGLLEIMLCVALMKVAELMPKRPLPRQTTEISFELRIAPVSMKREPQLLPPAPALSNGTISGGSEPPKQPPTTVAEPRPVHTAQLPAIVDPRTEKINATAAGPSSILVASPVPFTSSDESSAKANMPAMPSGDPNKQLNGSGETGEGSGTGVSSGAKAGTVDGGITIKPPKENKHDKMDIAPYKKSVIAALFSQAKIKNLHGYVVMLIEIDRDGAVVSIQPIETDNEKLANKLCNAAERTTFPPLPAEYKGQTLSFRLNISTEQ